MTALQPASDEMIPRSSGLAFRISNISHDITPDLFLESLQFLDNKPHVDGGGNLLGWSFAPSAASADAELYRTATVTFKSVPPQFQLPSNFVDLIPNAPPVIIDKDFYGLTPLYSPLQPTVDIIAVTGLAGHAFGSWKARGGYVMWLRDFLPEHTPTARILTYGYDSRLLKNDSTASIKEFSRNLLESLNTARARDQEKLRPIIFIGHSLGGLVIKQALTVAAGSDDLDFFVFQSCHTLLLFGVPNLGLEVTSLRSMVKGQPNSQLIEDLDSTSEFLRRHNFFWEYQKADDTRVVSIYETQPTSSVEEETSGVWRRTGPKVLMVSRDSAVAATPKGNQGDIFSIDANHSNIVKFENSACPDYLNVRSRIITSVRDAPAVVAKRLRNQVESKELPASAKGSPLKSLFTQYRGYERGSPLFRALVMLVANLTRRLEQEQQQILRWLSKIEYIKHHRTAMAGMLKDTGEWMLKKKQFREWRFATKSNILWLHGIPGSGKTKLTSMVIDTLLSSSRMEISGNQTHEPILYFYCNRTEPDRRDPTQIMLCFLKQISVVLPGLPSPVVAEYQKRGRDGFAAGQLEFHECKILLVSLLDIFPHTTIIIDALDESDPANRGILLDVLTTLALSSTCIIKVFISSRDDIDIELRLGGLSNLYIAQDNTQDIERFIQREIADSTKYRWLYRLHDEQKQEIMTTLLKKANGMFQWVTLQFMHLDGMRFEEDMMANLGKLPKTLKTTYSQILKLMREQTMDRGWELTTRALKWIMCSRQLLSCEVWATATYWPRNIPKDATNMLFELCHNLVMWDAELKVVRFIHLSVQEFLESEFDSLDINFMAFEICLSTFHPRYFPEVPVRTEMPTFCMGIGGGPRPIEVCDPPLDSFLDYSTIYWVDHVHLSYTCETHLSEQMLDQLERFLGTLAQPGKSFCNWHYQLTDGMFAVRARLHTREILRDIMYRLASTQPNPLFAAAYFPFGGELQKLWHCNYFDINCRNGFGESLLFVASMRGNNRVVDLLLTKLMSVDAGDSTFLRNAILISIEHRHAALAVQLIDADPTFKISENLVNVSIGDWSNIELPAPDIPYSALKYQTQTLWKLIPGSDPKSPWTGNPKPDFKEVMSTILAGIRNFRVTPDAVTEIARKLHHQVMEVILDRGPDLPITDSIVDAARENPDFGEEMVKTILSQTRKHRIIPAAVLAIVANFGPTVVQMLLARMPDIKITKAILIAAARNNKGDEVLALISTGDDEAGIDPETVIAIVQECRSSVMKLFFRRFPNFEITKSIVRGIARHDCFRPVPSMANPTALISRRERMMSALCAGDHPLNITKKAVEAVVENFDKSGVLMFIARVPSVRLTSSLVIAAAAGNRWSGIEMLEMLLRRDPSFLITEEIATLAAGTIVVAEKLVTLLLASNPKIQISEGILIAAAGNRWGGKQVINALLASDPNVAITEEMMKAAAGNQWSGTQVIEELLAKDPSVAITEEILKEAAANLFMAEKVLALLLPRDIKTPITEAILIAAAGNYCSGKEVMKLLVARGDTILITKAVVAEAVVNEGSGMEVIKVLLGSTDIAWGPLQM